MYYYGKPLYKTLEIQFTEAYILKLGTKVEQTTVL